MALVTFLPIAPEGATMATGAPRNLPFPMVGEYAETPTTSPLTFYPLKVSLAKAVEYWWRVKSFSLAFDIGDYSGDLVLTRTVQQGDEQELCKPENYEWTGYADPGGPSGNRITATVALLTPDNPLAANYIISHTEVVPALKIFIEVYFFDGDSSVIVKTYESGSPTSTITFDGNSLDCYYENSTEPFTFDITLAEWYSYSGTWDTANGAKN